MRLNSSRGTSSFYFWFTNHKLGATAQRYNVKSRSKKFIIHNS